MILYPLVRRATLLSTLLVAVAGSVFAQELSLEELVPGLKEQAIKMDIVARVLEQDREEVWNSPYSKVTIPGRPVGMKLVGNNIVVAVQFTPYRQRNGRTILVAQGQIWVDIPDSGIQYLTTLETIPLDYGEQIYFFPLGSANDPDGPRIEIEIELHPYVEERAEEDQPPPVEEGSIPASGRSPALNE
jgi:hypothetical protein